MEDKRAVDNGERFPLLFRLALQALGISRARAASELAVDKSLVGRWASGGSHPTEHNLTRITGLIAARFPHFAVQDWQRAPDDFARILGLDPALVAMASNPAGELNIPFSCLTEARLETVRRGSGFEGFWRTTRPSVVMDQRLFHDYGMIRMGPAGLLEVTMGGAGLAFRGWALPLEGNLFMMLDGEVGFTPIFLIFRGVSLPLVTRLDGLLLMATLDGTRSPAAVPIVAERIGNLSGNREADDRRCAEMQGSEPFADEAVVDPTIRAHLQRDSGAQAHAAGGDLFLMVSAARSMSRGQTEAGMLEG